ncbi:MAG: ERCC4 domain-containing protein [Pirellulales bacterium]
MSTILPCSPKPETITVVIDTREQLPLTLSPLKIVSETLQTGDYSIRGLESVIAIERKSISDLLRCIGTDRVRFAKEVQRLLAYPVRALVIESSWQELEAGGWRSRVMPQAVIGSLLGWSAAGLPIVMAGSHEQAGRYVSRLLYIAARRRWRESRSLLGYTPHTDSKLKIQTADSEMTLGQ